MELAAFSDRGIGTRERLEDYAADRIVTTAGGLQLQLAMVCDGAGGGEAGELAARLTSRTIFEYLEISTEASVPKLLIKAVEQANQAVYSELRGTGTSTVALAAVHLNDGTPYGRLYVANVGNSRIYLMRDGHIVRLNIDHTLANEYVYAGQMSFEEAGQLDDPEYVTRAIGIGAQVSVDIGFYAEHGKNFVNSRRAFRIGQRGMELREGDTVFAASDGLFPFVHDDEFLTHAMDDDVERATRTLMKYASDRGPEDNTALSMLFVPSSSRRMVQTGPRLSTRQRAGIGVFLLAIILLVAFLGLQAAAGENQRVAFNSNQTLVAQMILESSYTPTPTPLPPSATPTAAIVVGQVGNRFSLSQAGLPVFTGRYIDPLEPGVINYVGIAGLNVLSKGLTNNQANLYLQPSTSIRLNQVVDDPGKESIDLVLGRGGEMFAELGDFAHGGLTIAMEQNPDIGIQSQSACISVKQISADSSKQNDTDKAALACYGGGSCSFHFAASAPVSVAQGQEALLDLDNQKLISTAPISQADVDVYRDMVWQLNPKPDQLNCLTNWLDEDKDGINYPQDQCPTDFGSVAAQGCPDKDNDGVPDAADQCPVDSGPASNNGCPLPDVDNDGLAGVADACPFDAGPASNQGCPIEGTMATQYVQTQAAGTLSAAEHVSTPSVTPTPSPTNTLAPSHTPSPTPSPTATAIPLPDAVSDTFSTLGDQSLTISAPGVLANDQPNGGTVNNFNGATSRGGTVSLNGDGSFTYNPPNNFVGSDSFSYTLTSPAGSDSASVTINVLQPPPQKPVASFSANPPSGPAPLAVSFNDTSTGPINTYAWTFGDGQSSNAPSPSHTYTTPGTYTVTLTVTGPGGSDTATGSVSVVTAPPTACFNPTTSAIAVGGSVSFDAGCSTGSITAYAWTFGDGGTGTGANASHTYATAGTFTVTLKVTGPGGSNTTTGTVTVAQAAPVACFNPTTSNIASGGTVNFNAACSTGTITTYSWTSTDGGSGTGQTFVRTFTSATAVTYTITLTVTGPGGTSTATGTVKVNPLPTACFTPTSSSIATNGTVNFTAACSTNATSYAWTFGDGGTAAIQAPSHKYTANGTYTVTLTVTGPGGTSTTTGTVVVTNLPVAANDTYSTSIGVTLTTTAATGVLANDTRNGANITANTNPTHGSLTFSTANGSFTYVPNANYAGPDTFTYTLTNLGGTSTGTVNICVNPVAADDGYATLQDTQLVVAAPGVGANDSAVVGTTITFTPTSTQGGTVAIVTNGANAGRLTYTPPAGFTGTDTFTYTFAIGGCSDTATVTIMVMTANTAPVANNDTYTTPFNVALVVPALGVLANDTDAEGNTMTAALVTGPTNGTVNLSSTGAFTYTPTAGYSGPDSFTYTASDGNLTSAAATVNITVGANTAPVAVDDTYSASATGTLTVAAPGVLTNDSDADGNPITAVLDVTTPNGTLALNPNGSFTYTPTAPFTGADTFTYHVTDGTASSAIATVTINVTTNSAPVAVNDAYTTAEDTALSVGAPGVLSNDTDADGNPLTAVIPASAPAHGTVTLMADGSFLYTPNANYSGTDTFTYRANDGISNSATAATVTITITAVDDAPVAHDDVYTTAFNTTLTVPLAASVLNNDTDIDSVGLTATVATPPGNGTLLLNANGSFTYTPNAGFTGVDSFTYTASDGSLASNPATVTISVGVNSPPTANDDTYGTPINQTLTIAAPGVLSNDTDVDGDPITASIGATLPANGTVTLNADGSFSYVPNAGFTGTDTFTYTDSDGTSTSTPATVTINVGVNSPPVANGDSYTTTVNKTLTVVAPGVLGNDTDIDGDPLTVVLPPVSLPANGTLTLNTDGSFTYVPNAGFKGVDTFTYQANDGTANSTIATVSIGVGAAVTTPHTVAIQIPAPPPATRCTDTNFENPGSIRSHFTEDVDRADLFCRLIASGGSYMYWFGSPITNSGNVGAQNVLNLGLVAAVDVFSMRDVTGFVGDVDICLKGTGYMIYMNALGQPRVPQLWSAWTTNAFPGYTCTTLYAPGTVILVTNKPS